MYDEPPSTNLRVFEDAERLAGAAAALLIEAARARPALGLLLAGGTTPRRAYERVAATASAADFAGVHLWYGDERMVAPDHADSNHAMVARAWLAPMQVPPAQIHRIRGELPAVDAARAAAQELRDHAAGRAIAMDLVVLGIGSDGHTASLFPGDPALTVDDAPFAPARSGARVTATLPLLCAARRVIFLAAGEAKAAAVARALAGPDPATPASLVRPAGEILWLLDRAAASLLAGAPPGSNTGATAGD